MEFFEREPIPLDQIDELFFNSKTMNELPEITPTAMGDPTSEIGVICQHGFIGSNLDLLVIANSFVNLGFRVILPILPGHGKHFLKLHGVHHTSWIDTVNQAVDYLKNEKEERRIFILGHSLGGSLALITAARRDDLAGIITISAPVGYRLPVHSIAKVMGSLFPRGKITYKEFIFDDKRLFDNPYVKFLNENYGKVTFSTLKQVIFLIEKTEQSLPDVSCPVLIIHSVRDDTVPYRNAITIAEKVNSEIKKLLTLNKSYHIVVADTDKEEVIRESIKFIRRLVETQTSLQSTV